MSSKVKQFTRFKNEEKGSATIEFAFLFPAFMAIFLMGFETGFYMVRNVLLERAVDISVREVRLSTGAAPNIEALKDRICAVNYIGDGCKESLQIEMRPIPIAPGGIAIASAQPNCIDKNADPNDASANQTDYATGSGNQLIMVRVCALVKPFFPTTGLGIGMQYKDSGEFAMVAKTAFVNEPVGDDTSRDAVPFPVASNTGSN